MKNTILHKAETRGHANHGWLDTYHTFSFANYFNPQRMQFGALRVLNDDTIDPSMGFGTHPHNNMEIISIPLSGDLEHKDSMGNISVINNGEIQVMSAGTGITHSEYNKNSDKVAKFLQIWVLPNKRNVTPRYDQIKIADNAKHNELQQIVSPNPNDEGVWIHQDAWFHIGTFDEGIDFKYNLKQKGNGIYFFVINGDFQVENQLLNTRDGFGIWNAESADIKSISNNSTLLIMEVPMLED